MYIVRSIRTWRSMLDVNLSFAQVARLTSALWRLGGNARTHELASQSRYTMSQLELMLPSLKADGFVDDRSEVWVLTERGASVGSRLASAEDQIVGSVTERYHPYSTYLPRRHVIE